jgi:hypothetical protein
VAFGDDVGKARMSCLALFLSFETNASYGFLGPGISILSAKKGGFNDFLQAYADKVVIPVRTKQGLVGDDWKAVCMFYLPRDLTGLEFQRCRRRELMANGDDIYETDFW